MSSIFLKEICLLLFGIHLSYTFECDGSSKTMQKATDIQSNVLHDYLRNINCNKDNLYGNEDWQIYAAECFKNSSCVGIRSNTPQGICTLSETLRDEPVEIEGLWLVIEELERFEGSNSECGATTIPVIDLGTFTSPGYPGGYDNNANCVWTLMASAGHHIVVEFSMFQLEEGCLDSVVIKYGDESSDEVWVGCGDLSTYTIIAVSTGSLMTIEFMTDGSGTRAGFQATHNIASNQIESLPRLWSSYESGYEYDYESNYDYDYGSGYESDYEYGSGYESDYEYGYDYDNGSEYESGYGSGYEYDWAQ